MTATLSEALRRTGREADLETLLGLVDRMSELRDPAKRLAAWRRLITDTVESVTVAAAMTPDGRPSRLRDPRRIDIRLMGQHP